jgi:membrane protease YdiL (CAAX protease family)
MEQNQVPVREEAEVRPIPWGPLESWVGVLLLIVLNVVLVLFIKKGSSAQLAQSVTIVFAELAYVLPVVIILAWKRISWKYLGFGGFNLSTLGIGCGMLVIGYGIILIHNLILTFLGIAPQGEEIFNIFKAVESPIWLFVAAAIVAPLVEEIFFRGFLFQGFRKRYGWMPALLLSSFIFAAAHLDLASLIPTFILGVILTYMYHRSNSLWPGIIFHFLINATSTLAVYFLTQFPGLIPP